MRWSRPRSRLALLLILVAILGAAWQAPLGPVRAQDSGIRSGGIGLDRDAWEALHGSGEAGQSLVTYENDTYFVGFADDVVTFVERGWESQGGTSVVDATAAVTALLPDDTRLVETFDAPPTAAGPIGIFVERYQSDALGDRLRDAPTARTGGILVLYQEMTAKDRVEPNVTRVSIVVGNAPER